MHTSLRGAILLHGGRGRILQVGRQVLEVRRGRRAVQRLVVAQQCQVPRVRLEVRLQALRIKQLQPQLLCARLQA